VLDRSYCWLHQHWEPVFENNYRVCMECGHSFATERQLVIAHNDMLIDLHQRSTLFGFDVTEPKMVDDAANIYSCPICGHDWD
jgi:hypothetical protein